MIHATDHGNQKMWKRNFSNIEVNISAATNNYKQGMCADDMEVPTASPTGIDPRTMWAVRQTNSNNQQNMSEALFDLYRASP